MLRRVPLGFCTLTVVNRLFDKGSGAGLSGGCRGYCGHENVPMSRTTSPIGE